MKTFRNAAFPPRENQTHLSLDFKHYQPYQYSCHKMVWQKYVYPEFGCGYRAFLRYLKADTSGLPERRQDGSGIR